MNLDIESPQVKAIRQRYKASLKGKSDMVNDYLVLLIEPSGTSDDKLHNIYLELHKLAGSSGMYGYQDISDLARQGMQHADKKDVKALELVLLKLRNLLRQHA